MHRNISLGSNGVDRVHSLRKIPTQLRGTNFCTRSARFPPSFVRQPNGPEWYEMHQNISFGSNRVDRVRSLRKILTRLRGTKVCNSSARFAPSFVRQPNGSECTKMLRNAPKRSWMHPNDTKRNKTSVYSPIQWICCVRCEKFRRNFVARSFALVRPVFHRVL